MVAYAAAIDLDLTVDTVTNTALYARNLGDMLDLQVDVLPNVALYARSVDALDVELSAQRTALRTLFAVIDLDPEITADGTLLVSQRYRGQVETLTVEAFLDNVTGTLTVTGKRFFVAKMDEVIGVDARLAQDVPVEPPPGSLPALPTPGAPTIVATAQPEGSLFLKPGAHAFRIAAYQQDTAHPTLAGPAGTFTVTTEPNVRISWTAVPGATGYLVFHLAPGATAYRLIGVV